MARSNPEHSFNEQVLVSGDLLRGYTADGAISQHQAVKINGDYQVTACDTLGEEGAGVAAYGVSDGEELAIAGDDTEVRVEVGSNGATAGNRATVDGDGNFQDATASDAVWGTFNEGGSDGDIVELALNSEREVT